MLADAAFKGHEVLVTPLIGKLRLHVESYVDKDDFFISPLKHEDVILGAPWFDRLGAQMKFPERNISFTFRSKEHILNVNSLGSTIPILDTLSMDKSMKSAISSYMIFVKESSNDINVLQTQLGKRKEELDFLIS